MKTKCVVCQVYHDMKDLKICDFGYICDDCAEGYHMEWCPHCNMYVWMDSYGCCERCGTYIMPDKKEKDDGKIYQ